MKFVGLIIVGLALVCFTTSAPACETCGIHPLATVAHGVGAVFGNVCERHQARVEARKAHRTECLACAPTACSPIKACTPAACVPVTPMPQACSPACSSCENGACERHILKRLRHPLRDCN